jgi:NAD(P)-dependent dehydrogenase (short-subunit alcohol dehydrogenase family)
MNTLAELSNLSNRRALITGATGSLGRVFCDTLAELGADLILVDQSRSDLEKFASQLRQNWGVNAEIYSCNFENQEERTSLISDMCNSKNKLNILVNNAAFVGDRDMIGWSGSLSSQSVDTWRRALEVNLTAVFDLSKGLLPLLEESKGSNIINISSIYGLQGPDWSLYEGTSMGNPAAYSASKSGLIGLTHWLATTLSPKVRVNAIAPGGIYRNQPKEFVERYSARTPLGRMATEDDFRGAISFLASDMSQYVTGHTLVVDGGWGVW